MVPQGWSRRLSVSALQIRMEFCHPTGVLADEHDRAGSEIALDSVQRLEEPDGPRVKPILNLPLELKKPSPFRGAPFARWCSHDAPLRRFPAPPYRASKPLIQGLSSLSELLFPPPGQARVGLSLDRRARPLQRPPRIGLKAHRLGSGRVGTVLCGIIHRDGNCGLPSGETCLVIPREWLLEASGHPRRDPARGRASGEDDSAPKDAHYLRSHAHYRPPQPRRAHATGGGSLWRSRPASGWPDHRSAGSGRSSPRV